MYSKIFIMSTSPRVIFRHDYFQKMIGSERPVYLEYDLPDADFLKKKEADKDKNPSDDEFSICSIPSAEVGNDLKNDLFKEVLYMFLGLLSGISRVALILN